MKALLIQGFFYFWRMKFQILIALLLNSVLLLAQDTIPPGMKIVRDKYSEKTFYYFKKIHQNLAEKTCYLYIVKDKTGPPVLRVVVQYRSDSWLFLNSLTFKIADGTLRYNPETSFDRRMAGVYCIEKLDQEINPALYHIITKIIDMGSCEIKCSGEDYYGEIALNKREITGLKTVLEAYKQLGGTISR